MECRVYRRGERYEGAQGMTYFAGLSGSAICMVELELARVAAHAPTCTGTSRAPAT
jgi:uncharacterized RmlC-like cupin family protein